MTTVTHTSRPAPEAAKPAALRAFVLARLHEADGITYDELCRETAEAFPAGNRWLAGARAVRAVRKAMYAGLVTTEPDESCWLTPAGWQEGGQP